jgi:hypothetical protein
VSLAPPTRRFAAGLYVLALAASVAALALAPGRRAAPPAPPAAPPLDDEGAARLAQLSLDCVAREYPNKPGNVLERDEHARPPRELTPAFFGCYDWHSAVHGHFALARLARTHPGMRNAAAARAALVRDLTAERLAVELAYLQAERNRTFERPYGWGWLLRLAAELGAWDDPDGRALAAALAPVVRHLAGRTREYLERLTVPVREGTHASTAFALVHMLDYARGAGDRELGAAIERRARDFYGRDVDCPTHFEPSGEDFISPCLAEADLMRRVLPPAELVRWLDGFLPAPDAARFAPLRAPTEVRDPKDLRIGHLIGLALSRAWAFEGLAAALPATDRRAAAYRDFARRHRTAARAQMDASGYGGAHWLASFAIYLETGVGR